MKRKFEMIFEMQDNKGKLAFLLDGKVLPRIFGYDLHFNARTNEFKFTGSRLATDEYGQYFVENGETAIEELDLLKFFSDEGTVKEFIRNAKAETDFKLKNIRDTSEFNAKKMIRERVG